MNGGGGPSGRSGGCRDCVSLRRQKKSTFCAPAAIVRKPRNRNWSAGAKPLSRFATAAL